MQVFAAPRLQQLEDVDRSSSRGDEEAVGVGGELELVGWRQQLGHFGDLGAGRTQRWQPPHCHPQSPRVTLATPAPRTPQPPSPLTFLRLTPSPSQLTRYRWKREAVE